MGCTDHMATNEPTPCEWLRPGLCYNRPLLHVGEAVSALRTNYCPLGMKVSLVAHMLQAHQHISVTPVLFNCSLVLPRSWCCLLESRSRILGELKCQNMSPAACLDHLACMMHIKVCRVASASRHIMCSCCGCWQQSPGITQQLTDAIQTAFPGY